MRLPVLVIITVFAVVFAAQADEPDMEAEVREFFALLADTSIPEGERENRLKQNAFYLLVSKQPISGVQTPLYYYHLAPDFCFHQQWPGLFIYRRHIGYQSTVRFPSRDRYTNYHFRERTGKHGK